MKVKIKKLHPDAVIPKYAKFGDAGMDLTATSVKYDDYGAIVYGTGLAIEIPEGYVGLIYPRSSIKKQDLYLTNAVGVIDSGYRGEIMLAFKVNHDYWRRAEKPEGWKLENGSFLYFEREEDTHSKISDIYAVGDRVGQLIILPYPQVEFQEVEELSLSDRGVGGYGSTGN